MFNSLESELSDFPIRSLRFKKKEKNAGRPGLRLDFCLMLMLIF